MSKEKVEPKKGEPTATPEEYEVKGLLNTSAGSLDVFIFWAMAIVAGVAVMMAAR